MAFDFTFPMLICHHLAQPGLRILDFDESPNALLLTVIGESLPEGIGLAGTVPQAGFMGRLYPCLLYTSPSPRDS